MLDDLGGLFITPIWWSYAIRIVFFYLLAGLVHRLARPIAGHIVRYGRFTQRQAQPQRQATQQSLIASAISFLAFAIATLLSLALFVSLNTLVWIVGLFSAAFGLGARPIISDFLTGVSLIFEDTFAEGEKVELTGVVGVIEAVNLRTTSLRAPTGELYIVPNGEVRVVRNFSRGRFSSADIKLRIAAADLERALPFLEGLGSEAVMLLPNLLEPSEMRPRLLALVHERLAEVGIALTN